MHKAVAGLAISLGGAAESLAYWRSGHRNQVMPGGSTLIVAESYARRLTAFDIDLGGGLSNRRGWADLGDGVPDSLCADAENAVWYADVPNKRCVRVREGGAGAPDDRPRPRLLRVRARRHQRHHPVHARAGMERPGEHVHRATLGPGADHRSAGAPRWLAVGREAVRHRLVAGASRRTRSLSRWQPGWDHFAPRAPSHGHALCSSGASPGDPVRRHRLRQAPLPRDWTGPEPAAGRHLGSADPLLPDHWRVAAAGAGAARGRPVA
jgi:hypothetical protein